MRILLVALLVLSGCTSDDVLLRPLPAASGPSTEVTMIRPRSIVLAEWPVYVVVADQPVFDLRNGEHTRFRVPSGRSALAIRCTSGLSKPIDVRIEQDLPAGGSAYFIVEPKSDCVSIRSVDARGASGDLRTTRLRAVGTVDHMAQATGDAPAVFTDKPAAPLESSVPPSATPTSVDTHLAYWTPPAPASINVAHVVTSLRGADLRINLAARLQQMCGQLSILPRYRISVFGDGKLVEVAKRKIGTIPNLNDPEYQALQAGLLASYSPDDGVLHFATDGGGAKLAIGSDWCRKS